MDNVKADFIGLIIKNHRKISGYTQAELSELICIDEKQLGKIERGVHYPSVPTFLKLLSILNIDIKTFYKGIVPKAENKEIKFAKLMNKAKESEIELAYNILDLIVKQGK